MQSIDEKIRRWKRARRKALNMKTRVTIRKGSPADIIGKIAGCALIVWAMIWAFRFYIIITQAGL